MQFQTFFGKFTEVDIVEFQAIVRQRLEETGLSQHRVAREANLPQDAIRNVLAGHMPRLDRAEDICRVLDIPFHVGLPPQSESALEPSQTQITRMSEAHLKDLESSARTLNRVVAEAGGDPIPGDLRSALLGPGEIAETPAEHDVTGAGRPVNVIELASAAGGGAVDLDESVKGTVWFRRDWLDRHGLDAAQCVVIGVRGESMEPTLPDGCSILVNRASRRRREGRIYVVRTDDGLVVKRLEKDSSGNWLLGSEHPAWMPVAWPNRAEVIGQVRWMARSL